MIFLNHLSLIIDPITHKVQTSPFVQPVLDIAHSLRVEHVASRFECLAAFGGVDAFDEGREEKDHVAAFVHDRGAAKGAGDFAGERVRNRFLGGLVPAEVVDTVDEVDVGFVEDCCPLKWRLRKKQNGEN
jgi:hypothetical protein